MVEIVVTTWKGDFKTITYVDIIGNLKSKMSVNLQFVVKCVCGIVTSYRD